MGDANEEAKAKEDLIRTGHKNQESHRKAGDAVKKHREGEAKKGKMVADEPAAVTAPAANWPGNEVPATPGVRDQLAGALRVGQAGDVAFARDLLNSGQAPLGGVAKPEQTAAGAKESTAGSRAAKPALGLG
ncbi:hypothetical protein ACWF0M_02090 [Kribbella sp. NPDC055110]